MLVLLISGCVALASLIVGTDLKYYLPEINTIDRSRDVTYKADDKEEKIVVASNDTNKAFEDRVIKESDNASKGIKNAITSTKTKASNLDERALKDNFIAEIDVAVNDISNETINDRANKEERTEEESEKVYGDSNDQEQLDCEDIEEQDDTEQEGIEVAELSDSKVKSAQSALDLQLIIDSTQIDYEAYIPK